MSLSSSSCPKKWDQEKIIPLSEYLGMEGYKSYLAKRGEGIRRYSNVENVEETYEEDFVEKILKKIRLRRIRLGWKFNEIVERASEAENDTTQVFESSTVKRDQSGICKVCSKRLEAGNENEEIESYDVVDRACHEKPKDVVMDGYASRKSESSEENSKTALIPDPVIQTKEFKDQYTQTENIADPSSCVVKQTASNLVDASVGTSDANSSQIPMTEKVPPLRNLKPSTNAETSGTIPSLMDLKPTNVAEQASTSAPSRQPLLPNPPAYQSEYEKAKNWKPKTDKALKVLEQAKRDFYQVLIVGKGCRLGSIMSEFKRTTQEDLDLEGMGIPDLKTFLVQMGDLIMLRRERFYDQVYVFANPKTVFDSTYSHIAELVALQRDNQNVIPDPSTLMPYNIQELFEKTPSYPHVPWGSASYYPNAPQFGYNYYNQQSGYPNQFQYQQPYYPAQSTRYSSPYSYSPNYNQSTYYPVLNQLFVAAAQAARTQ